MNLNRTQGYAKIYGASISRCDRTVSVYRYIRISVALIMNVTLFNNF